MARAIIMAGHCLKSDSMLVMTFGMINGSLHRVEQNLALRYPDERKHYALCLRLLKRKVRLYASALEDFLTAHSSIVDM